MRISKFFSIGLLALVLATQSCSLPAQALTPQVVTVIVTAVPSAALSVPEGGTSIISATPLPNSTVELPTTSPTPTQEATSTPMAAATVTQPPAPSPTLPPQPVPTNTPVRVVALQPPAVSNLPAQGPTGGDIDIGVVVSNTYLMRIKAQKHGSKNDGDGIDHVLFTVSDKKNLKVYSNNEATAKYCIFKGGEPNCNLWPTSNGHYYWGSGGAEIKSGDYLVTVRVALKSDPGNESQWTIPITIKIP